MTIHPIYIVITKQKLPYLLMTGSKMNLKSIILVNKNYRLKYDM